MAKYVGIDGKVIAIESDPEALCILRKNVIANELTNIVIIPKAASDYTSDSAVFFQDKDLAGNSLRKDVLSTLGVEDIRPIQVSVDTGDNILGELNINCIHHLSITINGGEPEALLGLRKIISRSEHVNVTMPGWYLRDKKRLDDLLVLHLTHLGFPYIHKGKLGRVIAWK